MGGLALAFHRGRVTPDQALVINGARVLFQRTPVVPILHRAELMDLRVHTIPVELLGGTGLICRDHIRADVAMTFSVRVNPTPEDVLAVARSVGCPQATHPGTLAQLFAAKFTEAIKTVGRQLSFEDLLSERDRFRDQVLNVIGCDLCGYRLDDAAIDHIEQTPKDQLDPTNILDAQALAKITAITSEAAIEANQSEQEMRLQIARQNLEADKALLELKREQERVRRELDRIGSI